ncbi:G patch domain-containing protein 1 [Kwoniella heveanensis BCC8398]|uniref:G patch domain-containing protein 1 n=1 Tax=Kwoniella heveanensis BCC8398 TaxID=1296120 RepID=A0A1B9H1E1_9TREE|nr:G patch domain-containing protein 1 [Kwoniella heveanensis BCC8398]
MTSRLKHKLELENVNLNSAYLNESFVQIGTPLPALAEHKKDKQEYVPEWQQEVRDEQGRRRFHGAFTGGFSAGYYNTVGSKEGWAPTTFKSSRKERAQKVQRAEDFMDEEDLQSMRDDRKLENTDTFRSDRFGGTKEELAGKNLPSSLESLIAPAKSSIGEKLLQKLGWRPGQGIGPRVTLRQLRIQEGRLAAGRPGISQAEDDMDEAEAGKHTFAPRDVRLLVYDAKEDRQGLGFVKGSGMGALPRSRPMMGARHPDDDFDDPYAEAGPSTRRLAFDHGEDEDDDVILMGSSDRPGLGMSSKRKNGRDGERGSRTSDDYGDDRWHDGRPVLVGFALDPKGVPPDKWFAMPEIPSDWRPRPARVWGTTRRWDEHPGERKEEKEAMRGAPGRPLTFEQRGVALGEEQRISKAKSVYEYMSEKDKERLATLALNAPPPPPLSMNVPPPVSASRPPVTEIDIPPLSPRTASAALQGFIPYGDDPARQDRYRSYLVSQTYNTKEPNPVLKTGTIDEINKELMDFASSARIFKPMSYAMSNRFTSGSTSLAVSDLKQAKPGLHIFDAEKAKAEMEKPKAAAEVQVKQHLTPREMAAKTGMYGKMTRETRNFYPVKLVCRRFGVQDPHPEGDPGSAAEKDSSSGGAGGMDTMPLPSNDASWESKFIHQPSSAKEPTPASSSAQAATSTGEERQLTSLAEVGMADDANQGRDTLTYTKPNIDIFKAIFASDDEDDDEEEDGEDNSRPGTSASGAQAQAVMKPSDRYEDPFPAPAQPSVEIKNEGPVDLTTFKPVFKSRREDRDGEGSEGVNGSKPKKKKDKGKKRKGVLSFDVGDDDEEQEDGDRGREREREEKRKKKKDRDRDRDRTERADHSESASSKTRRDDVDMEGEWVEKPAVVPRLAGRKGAADFM